MALRIRSETRLHCSLMSSCLSQSHSGLVSAHFNRQDWNKRKGRLGVCKSQAAHNKGFTFFFFFQSLFSPPPNTADVLDIGCISVSRYNVVFKSNQTLFWYESLITLYCKVLAVYLCLINDQKCTVRMPEIMRSNCAPKPQLVKSVSLSAVCLLREMN